MPIVHGAGTWAGQVVVVAERVAKASFRQTRLGSS